MSVTGAINWYLPELKTPAREDEQVLACYEYGEERRYAVLVYRNDVWWNGSFEPHVAPKLWSYIVPPSRKHKKKT